MEIELANDSDTQTTIEEVRSRVSVRSKVVTSKHVENLDKYEMEAKENGNDYEDIPDLMSKVRNVPLTRGIGYRGCLSFAVSQASQKEMGDQPKIDIWLVDALQREYKVHYDRNSEASWDKREITQKVSDSGKVVFR